MGNNTIFEGVEYKWAYEATPLNPQFGVKYFDSYESANEYLAKCGGGDNAPACVPIASIEK